MMLVNYPIRVPSGVHCWEFSGKGEICEHFDNEGGHNSCTLGFYLEKTDAFGVRKAADCVALQIIKEL